MAKKDIKLIIQKQHPDFAEAVDGLAVSDLESRLLTYAKERENIREGRDADEGLNRLCEAKAEADAPYKEALKMVELKSRYLISLIKEKGGNV